MSFWYTHGEAKHFQYEKSSRPWFGPRRRAKQALARVKVPPITEAGFLDFLLNRLPDVYASLEWVRFYQFAADGFQYRIAVVNLAPDPEIRDLLFDIRADVAAQTGWYPLAHGSRAEVPFHLKRKQLQRASSAQVGPIGDLRRIVPIANGPEAGSAFVLDGTKGKLLMDFGAKWPLTSPVQFSACFLSHYHHDHSGGIWDAISQGESPIVLSRASLTYLWSLEGAPQREKEEIVRRSILPDEIESIPGPAGCWIEFFPVFHCPGAYGVRITDSNQTCLVYFGDICLRNGFCDFFESVYRVVSGARTRNHWVLLDATMVKKRAGAIEEADTPQTILEEMTFSSQRRNVIFLSHQAETLIYSYLQAFMLTREASPPIRMLLSRGFYMVLRALWKPVILRGVQAADPLVERALGMGMSNFAESHRLYPLTEEVLSKIPDNEACIVFCSPSDIERFEMLRARIGRGDVILAGTTALWRKAVPSEMPEVLAAKPRSILRVASPDWSFHSGEEDLASVIRQLCGGGARVLLFHNYPKVLKQFIRHNDLDSHLVRPLSMSGRPMSLVD